jgi:hemerythrin-like metal-binding protein
MEWSEDFATGIAQVDTQHRMLFRMTADFRAALDEGRGQGVYATLLESLDLYVTMHFGFEEGCMARLICPVASINASAHARFMERLGAVHEQHRERGFDPDDARTLVDFIDEWLVSHILRVDTRLREVVPDNLA